MAEQLDNKAGNTLHFNGLNFQNPEDAISITFFEILKLCILPTQFIFVSYGSHNKQRRSS
jgi:hypothetical protein